MQPWFVEFAERIDDGSPIYLACQACGEAALPPRTVCPECTGRAFEERSLSNTATVSASTRIFSTIPKFADETPYTIVIAAFDEGVRLTGQLRGTADVDLGETVAVGTEQRSEGEWLITFSPTD